jgi:hypothetical protein
MRRRVFIAGLGSGAMWPILANALDAARMKLESAILWSASTCMGVLLSGYRAVSRARRGGESRPYRAAHLRLCDEGARVRQVERRTEAIQNDHVETPERPLREGNAKDLVTYRLMCTAEILLTTKITRIVVKKRPPVRRSFPKFALSSQVVSGERHLAA